MISTLRLKIGPTPTAASLSIDTLESTTIFVGPNNSGKSLILREIMRHVTNGPSDFGFHIVEDIEYRKLTSAEALDELSQIERPPAPNENVPLGFLPVRINGNQLLIDRNIALSYLENPSANKRTFSAQYARFHLMNFDGNGRLNLLQPSDRGDLKYPSSTLAKLFTDDKRRGMLRRIILDAVGMYFVIDASVGSQLEVRFARSEPQNERSLEDSNLQFMRLARPLSEVSDGVNAFSGILSFVHSSDARLLFVDEPEAFLHPTLAHKLGVYLSKEIRRDGRALFAATHSSHFLMGCISTGTPVNIVRLSYDSGHGLARLLNNEYIRSMMNDPLLRSSGVMEAIFAESAVVTEADADRAFYHEINHRLSENDDSRAIGHCIFLNADNKQTIPRIVQPLRQIGVPAAAITDLDVLNLGGNEWIKHLQACFIPEQEYQSFDLRRAAVIGALNKKDANFKIRGGIGILSGTELETAQNLLLDLAKYGLFIVPVGEVERWLEGCDVPRTKGKWLHNIFSAMGGDPSNEDYVRPTNGDVWDFLGSIGRWVADPHRRGIPS